MKEKYLNIFFALWPSELFDGLYFDYRTCAIINRGYYFFSLFCTIGYYSRAVINWVRLLLMDFFSDYTKPLYILRQTACTGTKKNFLKLVL